MSKYDVIFVENVAPYSDSLFAALLKQCKPQGKIIIQQVVVNDTKEQLVLKLKLSGYTNVTDPKDVILSPEETKNIQQKLNVTVSIILNTKLVR